MQIKGTRMTAYPPDEIVRCVMAHDDPDMDVSQRVALLRSIGITCEATKVFRVEVYVTSDAFDHDGDEIEETGIEAEVCDALDRLDASNLLVDRLDYQIERVDQHS